MPIFVAGVSHDTAPLEVREQLSLSGEALHEALRNARSRSAESVILSTCNRFELYALSHETRPQDILAAIFGDRWADLEPFTYIYRDDEAVRHLFKVASGVDSLVLGEVQVLGQVQRAWQAAHAERTVGTVLSQMFHKGVALAKRVHNETTISKLPASVSYAAVALARQVFGKDLKSRRVLVIGTGEVGEGVARCLYEHGVHPTVVAHRQMERAQNVARRYEADVAVWEDLPRELAATDIVISSTAAPHIVLERALIEEAMAVRDGKPLYLIDLAVPRDIDPAAGEVPGVHLHNIDDLQAVVRTSIDERKSALPKIEKMISDETDAFVRWMRSRSVAPTIREMREDADRIARHEAQWALAKLPALTERERQIVEAMAARLVNKIMHGPIQRLKAHSLDAVEPEYDLDPQHLLDLFSNGIVDTQEA